MCVTLMEVLMHLTKEFILLSAAVVKHKALGRGRQSRAAPAAEVSIVLGLVFIIIHNLFIQPDTKQL